MYWIKGLGHVYNFIVRYLPMRYIVTTEILSLLQSDRNYCTRGLSLSKRSPITIYPFLSKEVNHHLPFQSLKLRTRPELNDKDRTSTQYILPYVHQRSSTLTKTGLLVVLLSWSQDVGVPYVKQLLVLFKPFQGLFLYRIDCGTKVGTHQNSSLKSVRWGPKLGCLETPLSTVNKIR